MIKGVDASDRVRASDGRIEVSIKHVIVAVFEVTGFRSFFDQADVTVE